VRQSPSTAIDSLNDFVERHPTARDARLTLARLLIAEKRYDESRQQFNRLLKDYPDNPDVIYPVAMLALQQGDAETGRRQLEKLLQTDFPDKDTVHFFLGQLEQEQKKPSEALEHYRQVNGGEQYIPARSRAALILLQQGKPEEARLFLHKSRASTDGERTQLILAEAQLLRDAGRNDDAYTTLETALKQHPDDIDLLYDAALTADRIGKPALLESHIKHLLSLKPDHAHALNALGYSWADRNQNLPEARALIDQASSLAPDDPFIMDSLGWVQFRQGQSEAAVKTLAQAYALRADPEIAAHLGEVLWTLGRKDEARRLLNEAAKQNPDNETVTDVIKKLLP
jgi:tetratricopeptide (TPR) repeat protein